MSFQPSKRAIARCSLGCLGLITSEEAVEVTYGDGNKGLAWTGIHLEDSGPIHPFSFKIGDPWSSRNPTVVGHLDDFGEPE